MGNVYGWYDPVCYQFSFYAYSNAEIEESILGAYREFVDEMTPYYALWLSMNGRILREQWTEDGCKLALISDAEAFRNDRGAISLERSTRCLKLSLAPGKALANFAVPSRSIEKVWRDEVARFTNLRDCRSIDPTARRDWLFRMMNCPTNDLRGLYFPKRCYVPNEIPLKLSYQRFCSPGTAAYLNEILSDLDILASHSEDMQPQYLHRLCVSIPRCMLDAMNQAFSLQYVWKDRQARLCELFKNSMGYIKMDSCEMGHGSALLSGNGSFIPGFSQYIPDIAWAMCLTDRQVEALGGVEYLKVGQVFHYIEMLKNNNFYLQLTPDISVVMRDASAKLWNIVSPHLRIAPCVAHSIGEVPISFRMGIDYDKLQIDDYGYYYISI